MNRLVITRRREELTTLAQRSHDVVLLAAVVGVLTGLAVALFDEVVANDLVPWVLRAPLWVGAALPVAGLLVSALVLRHFGLGAGTSDEYLRAYHEPTHQLRLRDLAVRGVTAVATLGSGAPMGLEGPSLYAGATIGAAVRRRLPGRFKGTDYRTLLVAGAAAGVAAIFKAPATGVVFALEVPYRDDMARRSLLPALVSAASSYLVFAAIHGTTALFPAVGNPAFSFRDLGGAVLLGIFAGLGARAMAYGITWAKGFAKQPVMLRFALVAPTFVGLFVLCRIFAGESLVVGPGYQAIAWAGQGGHTVWLLLAVFALRTLGTTASVAAGGTGGLFIPLAVGGALVGRATSGLVGSLDGGLFTVVGTAAFLGAGYRVPLAGVMFVAETSGRPGFVVPGLIAAVVAELMMGRGSVTSYQRSRLVTADAGR